MLSDLSDLSDLSELTYLLVSQNLSVVRSITDRVLVMKGGKIVEQVETGKLFIRPVHLYTRTLVTAIPHPPSSG